MTLREIYRLLNEVPKDAKSDVILEWDIISIERIRISSWIAFAVYAALLFVDYARVSSGDPNADSLGYMLLRFSHVGGIAFLPIALATSLYLEQIKESAIKRGIVIWGFLAVMVIAVYTHSVISYHVTGSLMLYVAFIFVTQWGLNMNLLQRGLFTVVSLGLIIYFIFVPIQSILMYVPTQLESVNKVIKTFEATFMTLIASIFGLVDQSYRLLSFMQRWQLAHDKRKLKRLERTRSHLFANLAHEFRNPLTVVNGLTGQIMRSHPEFEQDRLTMIRRNARRMLEMVKQILELSRLEDGDLKLNYTQFDLVRFVHYIEDSFKGDSISRDVEFIVEVPYLELYLSMDKEILFKILSNLLSNAFKYTAEGGKVKLSVEVTSDSGMDKIAFVVSDTGQGISKRDLAHIFERFYRVEHKTGSTIDGTGIGLNLVKELVTALNGEIFVESDLGIGTKFRVILPLEEADMPEGTMPGDAVSVIDMAVQGSAAGLPFSKGTVLVVEDNRDVNELLAYTLKPEFHVVQAFDGAQGVLLAEDLLPDIIISDIQMPQIDGFQLCTRMRSSELTSHIPVILVTGILDEKIKADGFAAGAMDVIRKPFDEEELLSKINHAIQWQHTLRDKFSGGSWHDKPVSDSPEEQFLRKVRAAVLENLSDSEFKVTDLCRAVGMSRTQLHNKLKAISGISTTAFITDIRLREACRLLGESDLTVSEIAYDVGFADPSYFSRVFSGTFGVPPSEYKTTAAS